ncbi:MAG: glycerophosphodiester phosphodiesterase [Spirochaetales bacterium]|nr:glycerophosphodiester phosphodiesterase [Spirochaetales bacterium]
MAITYEEIQNSEKPIIFGHRGYSSIAPENTLPAFELLLKKKIQAVELDVHICKSGEIVVTHDHNTKRVGDIEVDVENSDYSEIEKVDAATFMNNPEYKNVKIPTLNEVFDLLKNKVFYDIELKPTKATRRSLAKATIELIRDYGLEENCIISSFDPIAVRFAIDLGFKNTAVIYSRKKEVPWFLRHGEGRLVGCNILKPRFDTITKSSVSIDTKIMKYDLMTWTVDDTNEAQRLAELGVKGICANDPGLIKKFFENEKPLLLD